MKIHVMTLCTGYEYAIFHRFVGSLYDTGFSGLCYIFCQERDESIIERLRGVYPNVVGVPCDLSRFDTHMQSSRFTLMAEYLDKNQVDCDYLFICDSRDVLFQKNIEDYPLKGDLYAFEEEKMIARCPFNSRWISDVERVIQTPLYILHRTIICSGTIFVSKSSALSYLNKMSEIMLNPLWVNYPADQGPHNYLCYVNPLGLDLQFSGNMDNLVNTLGYGHKEVAQGKIVNRLRDVSYVAHQYDRMSAEQRREISVKYDFYA